MADGRLRVGSEHLAELVEEVGDLGCGEVVGGLDAVDHGLGIPLEGVCPAGVYFDEELTDIVKKIKDKGFARKIERDELRAGAELLGVDMKEHIGFIIDVLREHREELGLPGNEGKEGNDS